MKKLVLRLLGIYQDYRALRPDVCRFHPTCSRYASEAIDHHGLAKGSWFAVRRVLRCNPFGSYGFDPVPVVPARAAAVRNHRV